MPSTGVLSIQGDFDKHAEALQRAGAKPSKVVLVRTVEDLGRVDRLIIPGGESTTVGKLLERFGLGEEIKRRAADGMAIWGTCMGMILMATDIEDRDQYSLDLLDITVRRNAFGAQVHSFEDGVEMPGFGEPLLGVFIRAPIVTRMGAGVETFGVYDGLNVGARKGRILGTSFHPELTEDVRLHRFFLDL